ncbi:hypothetical protein Y032_0172g362 [Ancylostoma ceylanicum]|uniref:Uncharacterized protein n=1 Tax=Ancylostoma ceylanicum TaxID=53326 RepID=A0A016SVH5_9BILA|nr:hypothetical protein Y032_0172g362 [Ancylostoma ceylanicum]
MKLGTTWHCRQRRRKWMDCLPETIFCLKERASLTSRIQFAGTSRNSVNVRPSLNLGIANISCVEVA